MELKPHDVLVALKLALRSMDAKPTYAALAASLGLSASEVHAAVKRLSAARLVHKDDSGLRADQRTLLEFLVHGVKYAFPAQRGSLTRGTATSYAAPPLNRDFQLAGEVPPVWPDAAGSTRGFELRPLGRSAPHAARQDPRLYEALALVDAIREGGARERALATRYLTNLLTTSRAK